MKLFPIAMPLLIWGTLYVLWSFVLFASVIAIGWASVRQMLRKAEVLYLLRATNLITGFLVFGCCVIAVGKLIEASLNGWQGIWFAPLMVLFGIVAGVWGAFWMHLIVNLRLSGRYRNEPELRDNAEEISRELRGSRWFHRRLLRVRGVELDDITRRLLGPRPA